MGNRTTNRTHGRLAGAATDTREAAVMSDILGTELDLVLRRLPRDYAVASQATSRLVVGRPGAFVLCPNHQVVPGALEAMALRIARLADSTRVVLADHLSWVPFIDAVVVTPVGDRHRGPVTMAPLDLVGELLTTGPDTVAAPALDAVRRLLRENRLGVWRAGIGETDGRIDLCEPMPTSQPSDPPRHPTSPA